MKKTKTVIFKRATVALVAGSMVVMSTAAFAAGSPTKTDLSKSKVKVTTVKYNGKKQTPKITVNGKKLVAGKDYIAKSYKNSGTYTVKITGIGAYTGTKTVKFTIKGTASKKANKVTVKTNVKSIKRTALKKKAKKVKITVKKAKAFKGAVSYKVVKGSKYATVSKKGVVTLKKKAKKGTYKIKVTVKGYKKYNPVTKTVTIKVK